MGCGRLFEGDAQTMWASLQKLRALPPRTRVFGAHEYAAANAKFAVSVNPGNAALLARKRRVDEARARVRAWRMGVGGVESCCAQQLRVVVAL